MQIVLFAVLLMAGTGLLLGVVIGVFARFFRVESDARVELVLELLPGANCGGCGMAGCADFAKAVAAGEMAPSKCPVSSAEQLSSIARAIGIETGESFKEVAVVFCGGDREQMLRKVHYNGVADCVSASLVAGGPKGCSYGCLGMGSCARKCPFNAIEMINNLAIVHKELCVGCGACLASCPRNIIRLVPENAAIHIYCNSPARGAAKRQVCKVACIGCRKCTKAAPEKFAVNGFLASVNYENPEPVTMEELRAAGCPTGALLSAEEHLHLEKNDPAWSAE